MHLAPLDWAIVLVSIAVSFLPALFFWRRAGSSTSEFFTSGRAAPWWLVGVSMVATTFSTDTPNLVTNLVREHGVAELRERDRRDTEHTVADDHPERQRDGQVLRVGE